MPYPTTLAPEVRLLTPDMELGDPAIAALQELHDHGFVAGIGLTEYHQPFIARIANERPVREFCPNDAATRVGTLPIAREWNGKGGGRGYVSIFDLPDNQGEPLSAADLGYIEDVDMLPVAYGWSGFLRNKHIPGADITTAYRTSTHGRQLARERREGPDDHFGLGWPIGELVIAAGVHVFGADPKQVSLETWASNKSAVALYDRIGFVLRATEVDKRPTLQEVGTIINGHEVYRGVDSKGNPANMVRDTRLFQQLGITHPLAAAA